MALDRNQTTGGGSLRMAKQPKPRQRSDSDRRVRQADRLARILNVLRLIQSRGLWNAKTIAAELGVTQRTVYRDLKALEFAGVPWYFDDAESSYRVRPDFRFPVPNLTEDELLGQAVATVITKADGLKVAGSAAATTQKIAAAASDDTKQLLADAQRVVTVLGLQIADSGLDAGIVTTIQKAILSRKRVCGTYSSPYGPRTVDLHLDPYRICLIKNAWYLVARPVGAEVPRTYRIGRFRSLSAISEQAVIPDAFDVAAYFGNAWAVFRGSKCYRVRMRFLPEAATMVMETRWHSTQTATTSADGSVVLAFEIDGLEEICQWLVGWTGVVEVLEPEELRRMVAARLETGLRLNRSTGPHRSDPLESEA